MKPLFTTLIVTAGLFFGVSTADAHILGGATSTATSTSAVTARGAEVKETKDAKKNPPATAKLMSDAAPAPFIGLAQTKSEKRDDKKEERIRVFAANMVDLLEKIVDKLDAYADSMDERINVIEDKKSIDLTTAKEELAEARAAVEAAHYTVDTTMAEVEEILDTKNAKDAFPIVREEVKAALDEVGDAHTKLVGTVDTIKKELGIEEEESPKKDK